MEIKEIIKIYNITFGMPPEGVEKLPGAGSSRRYYRVYAPDGASGDVPPSVIACVGGNVAENDAFIALSEIFGSHPMPALTPYIYAVSADRRIYLQTDFGRHSLMDLIDASRKDATLSQFVRSAVGRSLSALAAMQNVDPAEWRGAVMSHPFGPRLVRWDLNYFKYEFLKPARVCFDESRLEDDFDRFTADVTDLPEKMLGFMYRDFQSRNVMLVDDSDCARIPAFIDYQGAMYGPCLYDAVSMLWQAKAGFSDEFRRTMLDFYIKEYCRLSGADAQAVEQHVPLFVLLRTLQVLGAYGFRGLVEKKSHFIESIPAAISNLRSILEAGDIDRYPELRKCCESLTADTRWNPEADCGKLCVKVFSFSYKKGYPEDLTGNGGGFMFDCRGMHNPGRYAEYRQLTGEDAPVAEFLEERGEVQEFLEAACRLVDHSVDTYRRRGFRNLQVGFGCTGGQHRSVYCARHLAEHLAEKYDDIRVELLHREQWSAPLVIESKK